MTLALLVNGVAPAPFNIHNGTRWSSALGYLDPVRGNANLTIVGDALVGDIPREALCPEELVALPKRRLPPYDAMCVRLAEALNAAVVTCDCSGRRTPCWCHC